MLEEFTPVDLLRPDSQPRLQADFGGSDFGSLLSRPYRDQPAPLLRDSAAWLLPALPPGAPPGGSVRGGLMAWQLRRVIGLIEQHLASPVTVETLAAAVRVSPGHFWRAFKRSMGEAPHAFITRQRIRRAQYLMLTTEDALSQIACDCGLFDQAHLTRLFRKCVGETPHAWRKLWRVP